MAMLMDPIAHLDNTVRRKFKKLFDNLGDDYCIRSPVLESLAIAPLLLQGPDNSWLFMGYYPSNPDPQVLSKYLNFNQYLAKYDTQGVRLLAVTDTGRTMFDPVTAELDTVVYVERKAFFNNGQALIKDALTFYSKERSDAIKKKLFPESYINPVCILKKPKSHHDTSARISHQFLDYDQEIAAKLDLLDDSSINDPKASEENSIRLINGVAGSGKTLILINRALTYCQKYPEHKVLMLIHNNPIVAEIKTKIVEFKRSFPDNLEICTFHSYAYRLNQQIFGRTQVEYDEKKITGRLDAAMLFNKQNQYFYQLLLSSSQLVSELEFISDFLITSEDDYLKIERHGRGFALNKAQRQNVWQLYLLARKTLTNRSYVYWASMMIKDLCLLADLEEHIQQHRHQHEHILIDEAQFFAPSWLFLVKKLLTPDGKLYICADPNQGFLKSRLSWKSLGLNVAGRTKKLKHSYRTTYEILLAANTLLNLLDEDSDDFVKPSFEDMEHGEKPLVIYSSSQQDEIQRLSNELKVILNQGHLAPDHIAPDHIAPDHIAPDHIIVLCSEVHKTYKVKDALESRLGKGTVVNCSNSTELKGNLKGKIRVMTINSCTGVEGILTFVIGVGYLIQNSNAIELNDDERKEIFQQSMRKLYVAMTRASQRLVLFSTVPLPEQMQDYVALEIEANEQAATQ